MDTVSVLTPLYNDWDSFSLLLPALNDAAKKGGFQLKIFVADDCSTDPRPVFDLVPYTHIHSLDVILLARNLGHQRAIAVGLAALNDMSLNLPIIVMDSDGEDLPSDILSLKTESIAYPGEIVFARRQKRSEGIVFRTFFFLFKAAFFILTGKKIGFGNFSLIPPEQLSRIAHLQEIWNHFPAGIMRSGLRWRSVPTIRGHRYAGTSRMNLTGLALHGLSAISVYVEIVYARLLFLSFGLIALDVFAFLFLVYIRFGTPLAIPGWATNVAVGLTVVMAQAILFLALLSFVVLSYRSVKMFIPATDYKDYLLKIESLK